MPVRPHSRTLTWLLTISAVAILWQGPMPARAAVSGRAGSKLWLVRYNGGAHEVAEDVAFSPDGATAFVTGASHLHSTDDFATVAYDSSTGAELWVARYNGPDNGNDHAVAIAVSPDGTIVFVTGYSEGATLGSLDYATIAYDGASGAELWNARYNGPANSFDQPFALAASPDGTSVAVTGTSAPLEGIDDYLTVDYSAVTGDQQWTARYSFLFGAEDTAEDIAFNGDGSSVFVTGYSNGATSFDYATLGYDAHDGGFLWVARYDGPSQSYDQAAAITVSPDNRKVFVTGKSIQFGYDYATIAYDARNGARIWLTRSHGPGSDQEIAQDIAVSPDGGLLFVTGDILHDSIHRFMTVAYDAGTGARRWVARYNRGTDGELTEPTIAVSPDGTEAFITGSEYGASDLGYNTVAYDAATGAQEWSDRIPEGQAFGIAVTPDGSTLVVTGAIGPFGSTSDDYGTVAYDLTS